MSEATIERREETVTRTYIQVGDVEADAGEVIDLLENVERHRDGYFGGLRVHDGSLKEMADLLVERDILGEGRGGTYHTKSEYRRRALLNELFDMYCEIV